MGCYSGLHADFESITVVDFCGAFIRHGDVDPIDSQMDVFLREDVDFINMPADIRGWK
jgi:hypothetical protein